MATDSMTSPDSRVEIGYVARAHGTRGNVVVVLHNPESSALLEAKSAFVGDAELAIEGLELTKGGFRVGFESVTDRDQAEALRGHKITVSRSSLELEPGEVLLADLVGCRALLSDGSYWGDVTRVELGAQNRLVIVAEGLERELPLVDAFVPSIDLDSKTITVEPPEGLPSVPAKTFSSKRRHR